MTVLHIIGGDAPRPTIEALDLDGDILVWREAQMMGPVDPGDRLEEYLDRRAAHLANAYGANRLEARRDLGRMETTLAAITSRDDVVLWFEDDLFCHVHIWYLLSRLGACRPSTALISGPDRLGEQGVNDLARCYRERQTIDQKAFAWGAAVWAAFAATDPSGLVAHAAADDAPVSFSPTALRLHLERFPDSVTGLGRLEHRILESVSVGIDRFGDVFRRLLTDDSGYGVGDAQVYYLARQLATARQPLLRIHGADCDPLPSDLRRVSFSITDEGRACLAGELDAASGAGPRWIGGVEFPQGQAPYRWNRSSLRIEAESDDTDPAAPG